MVTKNQIKTNYVPSVFYSVNLVKSFNSNNFSVLKSKLIRKFLLLQLCAEISYK